MINTNALRQIAQSLSSAVDLDTTLALVVRKTTEAMQVDSCTLYLLDSDEETLRLQATTGLADRALGRATLRVGEGMTGYAVLHNQPVHAAVAQDDPHFKTVEEAEEFEFQSLLAVPLVVEQKPLGALNVQTVQAHDYTAEEVELLHLIADLAAGAVAKAQLYESQHRQLQELQMLAQLSAMVNAPQYLDDLLEIVTDMAAQSMNAAVCSLFMLNEDRTQLELRSARRRHGRYQHRPPLQLGEGVIGQVAQTGESQNVHDIQACEIYVGKALARQEGLISMLAVPLQVRGHTIGVLACYTDVPHAFTDEQESLFMTLANQTALAIENARLVTNAAVVREMHHRIKNNLQTVAALMRLQMRDAETNNLTTAEVLELSISRIHSIAAVHEVLSNKGFRLVSVRDVLQRIARMTQQTMTRPGQDVAIKVHGDALALPSKAATSLALVVNELMLNALAHGFHGRDTGQVHVSLGRSAREYIILVRDNGRGFPTDLEQKKGLGLEIVHTLVTEDLHGRVKFNHLPDGAEVSIRLPRPGDDLLE